MNYDLSVNVLLSSVVKKTDQRNQQGSTKTSFNSLLEAKRPKFLNIYEAKRDKQIQEKDEEKINGLAQKKYAPKTENTKLKTESRKDKVEKNSKEQNEVKKQDAEEINKEQEKILKKIAHMLGISMESLKSILELDNAKIQELKIDSAEVFINKLKGLIDIDILNKKQIMEEVKSLLKELKGEISLKIEKSGDKESSDKIQGEIKEDINSDERVQEKAPANDTSEDTEVLEVNVKEIKNSEENIQSEGQQNNINPHNKKDNSIKKTQEVNQQEGINSQNTEDEKDIKIKHKGEENSEFTDKEKEAGDWKDKIKVITVNTEKENNNFKITQDNMPKISTDMSEIREAKMDTKIHNTLPYNKDEILKQVVDKAAVLISEDKAEMIINLKPDNLGKLMLKIVTEKGIVTAQMVAESHQVRQIIESNLNILRDTLEKQGITVQEFSVSVGQDSWSKGFNHAHQRNFSKRSADIENTLGMAVGGFTYQNREEALNNYLWPESTINFTA